MSRHRNEAAKKMVLSVLSDPAIGKMKYRFSTRGINPMAYARVALAIYKGDIKVVHNPTLQANGVGGLYCPVLTQPDGSEIYDVLMIGWTDLGGNRNETLNRAMVVVHECTHAAFDLLKLPLMQQAEHEMGAYIAGALYTVARCYNIYKDPKRRTPAQRPEKIQFKTKIESVAWDIALRIFYEDRVPQHMWTDLDKAIKSHSTYRKTADNFANNDGVGRASKPAPKPNGFPKPKAFGHGFGQPSFSH